MVDFFVIEWKFKMFVDLFVEFKVNKVFLILFFLLIKFFYWIKSLWIVEIVFLSLGNCMKIIFNLGVVKLSVFLEEVIFVIWLVKLNVVYKI